MGGHGGAIFISYRLSPQGFFVQPALFQDR
jgi:hypothetical protein